MSLLNLYFFLSDNKKQFKASLKHPKQLLNIVFQPSLENDNDKGPVYVKASTGCGQWK